MSMPDRKHATQITQLPSGNELLVFYFWEGSPKDVLEHFPAGQFARNVFYVDPAENVLWQIAAPKRTGNDCFVGMIVDPRIVQECDPEANLDQDVIGITYFGFRCRVNLNDGSAKALYWSRG